VIFITASATSHTAIEAMKLGALDYLVKPLDLPQVREAVGQALKIRRLMRVPVQVGPAAVDVEDEASSADPLIGNCSAMQEVYKAIGRVAQHDVNVLIRGESGTGKELVARAIYQHSPRANNLFLAINCSAIPETLLESELFGHEKGSFTGAVARRIGKFEQCSGGTLFLDEVGDMTPLMQSKVLRTIQEKQFERVGGNETISTNCWIITATNRDLETMVAEGEFRADLFYRLNGYTITLPSLRDRGEDIPLLVSHLLRRFNRELDKEITSVSPEAMELLTRYSWPGNVRELQSVLKQAMLQATGPNLLPEFLSFGRHEAAQSASASAQDGANPLETFITSQISHGTTSLHSDCIAYVERILLTHALRHTQGNQSQAAMMLGITRGCLRSKARAYGITVNRMIEVDEDADEKPGPLHPEGRKLPDDLNLPADAVPVKAL
jgi:two-component system nitrogen regulation response regulator GlnG